MKIINLTNPQIQRGPIVHNNYAFLSLGGCGNNLLNQMVLQKIIKNPNNQAFYINFSLTDLNISFLGNKFIIDAQGTGRDPKRGSLIIKENEEKIKSFFQKIDSFLSKEGINEIFIISSLGGGTGSSLIPFTLDFFNNNNNLSQNYSLHLIGILSSIKEGVSISPNMIKTYHLIYNEYVLKNKLKSFFTFDNFLFEEKYQLNTYDYNAINANIIAILKNILTDYYFNFDAGGLQTLDQNEYKRVLNWSKGISDIYLEDFSFEELSSLDENNFEIKSSIFSGKHKYKTAKAVATLLMFKEPQKNISQDKIVLANKILTLLKKEFNSAFFVFGFIFEQTYLPKDFRVLSIINGLENPTFFNNFAKKTSKNVEKIKRENLVFEFDSNLDLEL